MQQRPPHDRVRVAIVVSAPEMLRALKDHLGTNAFEIVTESADLETGAHLASELRPDLLFLDLPDDGAETLEVVYRLRRELPSTGLVLVSDQASPQLILSAMRAGAHEFLTLPLQKSEFDSALERLKGMFGQRRSTEGGRVFAVYPTKGGVGASSLATNLAVALQGMPDSKTVLVDFNLQVGDLALLLDIQAQHSFAHSIGDGTIDRVKLRSMLTRHPSGLHLLTMADRPEESNFVQRDHISELVKLLRSLFDNVVVDLGRHIDERTIELLDHSDLVLLMTSLDVPTIRNTRSYLELFRRLEIPAERVQLIVNRAQENKRVSSRDLVRTVGREVLYAIPNDYAATSAAVDSGNPVVLNAPGSKLAGAYRGLAKLVTTLGNTASSTRSAASSGVY